MDQPTTYPSVSPPCTQEDCTNQQNLVETTDDKDSVVSDRCWEPGYKSDSRKWLLRDGNPQNRHCSSVSTMKNSFNLTIKEENQMIGKRAKMLLEQMRHEAEVEALAEASKEPTIEKYISTYDDTFCLANFEPKEPIRQREMYEKHPLYNSSATTYWQFQHDRHVSERPPIMGVMPSVNFNQPFKRNAQFSKPMEDLITGAQVD